MAIKKYVNCIFLLIIAIIVFLFRKEGYMLVQQGETYESTIEGITVAIDAGHGGFDPGKVGINNALEKDINLSIALKLEEILKKQGISVIMTRTSDTGLYEEQDSNKKRADMKNRINSINEGNVTFAVSIHQNSFSQESSKGAQVFYHASSDEGKQLAEILQEQIKLSINDGNHRVAKSNDSYYMLKKSTCPLVIVECGFLSNSEEAALLITEEYQQKMANAICKGILEYLKQAYSQQ